MPGQLLPPVQSCSCVLSHYNLLFILQKKDSPLPACRVSAEFPLPVCFWVIAAETLQGGWVPCGELNVQADMIILNQKYILSLVREREGKMQ